MQRRGSIVLGMGLLLFAQVARADWTPAKRLTWTLGYSNDPAIATDSDNIIHVVWSDWTPGNSELFYKRSTNGGTAWSSAKRLTWTSSSSYNPAIATEPGTLFDTVHVVWGDYTPGNYEIYYKRSSDGGTTWGASQRLTWTSAGSEYPAIALDSSNIVHVIWSDNAPGKYELYYKRSTDGGTSWSASQRLTWTPGSSASPIEPDIAIASGDDIHVVWDSYAPGNEEIYYKRSTNGGTTWGAQQRLTWTSGSSEDPQLGVGSSNTLHVVWLDTPELYYKRSTNGGTTWGAAQRLTWMTGSLYNPAMAIDSGNTIHVVWEQYWPGNNDLYYKNRPGGGTTWSATQRLTWTQFDSYTPALATDSANGIHVVWSDLTPGNKEIYYKKGT